MNDNRASIGGSPRLATWLDRLNAVPTVGFRFAPVYSSTSKLIDSFEPVLRKWSTTDGEISIGTANTLTSLSWKNKRGITVNVDHENLVVQFQYVNSLEKVPGEPMRVEVGVEPMTYSEALEEVAEIACELVLKLPDFGSRLLTRIGIVSSCSYSEKAVPPGIEILTAHLGSPWGTQLEAFTVALLTKLGESDLTEEKCHHHLQKPISEGTKVVYPTVQLDWQRYFKTPVKAGGRTRFNEYVSESMKDALAYFDRFGTGDFRDE